MRKTFATFTTHKPGAPRLNSPSEPLQKPPPGLCGFPGEVNMPKLLDEVRDLIRARHYSIRTEEAYTRWIKEYIFYHDKRPP